MSEELRFLQRSLFYELDPECKSHIQMRIPNCGALRPNEATMQILQFVWFLIAKESKILAVPTGRLTEMASFVIFKS